MRLLFDLDVVGPGEKFCPGCKQILPLEKFYRNKSTRDGVQAYCKTCNKAKNAESFGRHYKERKEHYRVYNAKESTRRRDSARRRKRRKMVLDHYGGKCACCGEDRFEFLAIDHIDGKGGEHRKRDKAANELFIWLIHHGFPAGYRVLCHNCNMARGLYGYCPHHPEDRQEPSNKFHRRYEYSDDAHGTNGEAR